MLSWRTITSNRIGGGKALMLRLHDDEIIWRASPEMALDQEVAQFKQRGQRYAWRTQPHRSAGDRIDHPGRSSNDIARRNEEAKDTSLSAFLARLAAKTAPEIRVPAITDINLLPNMGRMTWVCGG
jgi:hypothetical protein